MTEKILVADGVSAWGVEILQQEYEVVERPQLTAEELAATIGDYVAIVVRSATRLTADVLAKATRLRVIGRAGVGVDNIDIPAATKRGIVVLNAPNGNTNAATEHALALMLALARRIPEADASLRAGRWERAHLVGLELKGRTLGVLGLGRIGTGVALRAQAFGMDVIAYDPFLTAERAAQLGVRKGTLAEVLAAADFLTLHLPLTDDTRGLINRQTIAAMKDGVRIINAARGACIVVDDLVEALRSGKVAGAALDVFPTEPLAADSPLTTLPQVVLTPHLGASTVEAQEGVAVDVARGILQALRGEVVPAALNVAPIAPELMPILTPYFPLARALGNLAVGLAQEPIRMLTVEYTGELVAPDTRAVTTTAVQGLLNPILQEQVNQVNAAALAAERGIEVREVKSARLGAYHQALAVEITTAEQTHRLVGVLTDGEPYVVEIDAYDIRFAPRGQLLLVPHDDCPGMIGKIGTALGEAGVNIRSMQVGQTAKAGKNIMAIGVDRTVTPALRRTLEAIAGVDAVSVISGEGRI